MGNLLSDFAILIQMDGTGFVMAALLLGHVLGDFVFQSDRMVRNKSKNLWLIRHAVEITVIHALVLLPLLSWVTVPLALGIGVSHGLIDRFKRYLEDSSNRPLFHFALDQCLHLLVLCVAGFLWTLIPHPAARSVLKGMTPWMTSLAVVLSAYAFIPRGGAAIVGGLLQSCSRPDKGNLIQVVDKQVAMGRLIGIMERTLLLTLVLIDQWGALALVLAAKSIARFKDLQERPFAEYYLVGTLASVLVAVAAGLAVKLLI